VRWIKSFRCRRRRSTTWRQQQQQQKRRQQLQLLMKSSWWSTMPIVRRKRNVTSGLRRITGKSAWLMRRDVAIRRASDYPSFCGYAATTCTETPVQSICAAGHRSIASQRKFIATMLVQTTVTFTVIISDKMEKVTRCLQSVCLCIRPRRIGSVYWIASALCRLRYPLYRLPF